MVLQRAIPGNGLRHGWQPWHTWQRKICKLQVPLGLREFESHPRRQKRIVRTGEIGCLWNSTCSRRKFNCPRSPHTSRIQDKCFIDKAPCQSRLRTANQFVISGKKVRTISRSYILDSDHLTVEIHIFFCWRAGGQCRRRRSAVQGYDEASSLTLTDIVKCLGHRAESVAG